MANKDKKIFKLLSDNPSGLKASEIADKLNITRREVNQFLYYEQDTYVVTDDHRWVSKIQKILEQLDSLEQKLIGLEQKCKKKKESVLSKLNNSKNAKVFTSRQFNSIANWKTCKTHTGKKALGSYRTKTGNLIDYDSEPELQLLKYLDSSKDVLEIGAQNLEIPYDTAFRYNKPYYPDFIILKSDGHIAIIESKSIKAMSYHKNLEKYIALKNYCKRHGYEYMMIAPDYDYMTFEDLKSLSIPTALSDRIKGYLVDLMGEDGALLLEPDDVPLLYKDLNETFSTREEFEVYLHALVIQKGWYNKFSNGFMVYETPQR